MLHLGLLITKDDDEIVGPWFRENAYYFDDIVCLDGSQSDCTREAAAAEPNVRYLHERDCSQLAQTDHGLREVAHRALVDCHGHEGWVTICHVDEFFYHDPRKCCERAEAEQRDGVFWFALHFLPHPTELPLRQYLSRLPAHQRFRHYHWDYEGTGLPWQEFRSFRNESKISWRSDFHGSAQPDGCTRIAEFHPAYQHFKAFSLDPTWYAPESGWTRFGRHWQQVKVGQTGLNWPVASIKDLFVSQYAPYRRCDTFYGSFDHAWNIGEQYR